MGMNKEIREKVYSSGEAALNYLRKNSLEEKFYHVGPPRDFDLFLDFKKIRLMTLKKVHIYSVQDYLKNKVRI